MMKKTLTHTAAWARNMLALALVGVLALGAVPLPAEAAMVRIVLTSGTSWSVPADWNSSANTIEVIGGGGGGGGSTSLATRAASGGGGGGYSRTVNVSLTPSASVTYAVGAAGTAGANNTTGGTGGDTYLCNSTSNCASILGSAVVVGAKGGTGAAANTGGTPGVGGAAGSGVGTVTYSGGDGVIGVVNISSGGGGGAAGPNGNGVTASTVGTGTSGPGRGGAGGAGYGGAGGGLNEDGGSGAEWETVGSGGGAGTRSTEATGRTGGTYGGGGGGYYSTRNNGSGGPGGQGVIVITYFPTGSFGLTIGSNVRFLSNLTVRGSVAKGAGTFVIDHPQAPATKLLYHSFVESPDVKNIYDGIVTLNAHGEATVQLPAYFEALNKDFRYQYFPLEEPMPELHVGSVFSNGEFTLAGGTPGGRVSWQITGIRHDPYIQQHPITVEVEKGQNTLIKRGECLFAPACE